MKRAAILCMALALSSALGAAEFDLPQGKWWENERLVARLELSEEQRQQIRELVYEHAMRMIDLSANVKRSELELGNLVGQDEFKTAEVRAAFTEFQTTRQALELERFELLLSVRTVLTTRQWLMIREFRRDMRRDRMSGDRPPGNDQRRPPRQRPPQDPEGY